MTQNQLKQELLSLCLGRDDSPEVIARIKKLKQLIKQV
jgi:Trp operon repressor